MAKLQCEICGGGSLLKQGDVWVCRDCGSQYTAEDVRRMFQSAGGAPALSPEDPPTEVKVPKDETVTVAQAESEAVRVQASDFTIVAGTLTRYNGSKLDVVIPDGVITIGERCFFGMSNLRSVTIPGSVQTIGEAAFRNCSELTDLTLSEGLKKICASAFEGCANLTEVALPESVEWILSYAFKNCVKLKKLSMGLKTQIDDEYHPMVSEDFKGVCWGCYALRSIVGGSANVHRIYVSVDGPVDVTILDGETEIVEKGFYAGGTAGALMNGRSKLASITIPKTVKKIGASAFDGCMSVKAFSLTDVESVGRRAFSMCKGLSEITFAAGVKIGEEAFSDCTGLREIVIPERATVEKGAFCGCGNLTSVTLPNDMTKINSQVFCLCIALQSINLPSRLTWVGDGAFSACAGLPSDVQKRLNSINKKAIKNDGCYVATCVYGSYDCPEVWTLRRYRDDTLGATWYGRLFIRFYYAVAPTLVKWFGENEGFRAFWRKRLDRKVAALAEQGVEDTPYEDKDWRK